MIFQIEFDRISQAKTFMLRLCGIFGREKQNARRKRFRFSLGGIEKVYPRTDRILIDANV